jgi:hypothetical protein
MQQSPLSRFLNQYYVWIMIVFITSIALFVRINVFSFESGDYHFFYIHG